MHVDASTKYYKKKKKKKFKPLQSCEVHKNFAWKFIQKRKEKKIKQKLSFLHVTLLRDLCPCQIVSNYLKKYGSYCPYKILVSGEITTSQRKCDLSLLHVTCQLVLIYDSTKYYRNNSNHQDVMVRTRIWLRIPFKGDN